MGQPAVDSWCRPGSVFHEGCSEVTADDELVHDVNLSNCVNARPGETGLPELDCRAESHDSDVACMQTAVTLADTPRIARFLLAVLFLLRDARECHVRGNSTPRMVPYPGEDLIQRYTWLQQNLALQCEFPVSKCALSRCTKGCDGQLR